MKLHIQTIVLDGMMFLQRHLSAFNKLTIPWSWSVAEGYAEPVGCTSWCKPQTPRVSIDGSHEWLKEVAKHHPRVKVYSQPIWNGKLSMFHKMTDNLTEPGLIMQIDCDELWDSHQLENIVRAFQANPKKDAALFRCRYFLGPSIVITSRNTYGGYENFEWLRCWRFIPGMRWISHEPAVFNSRNITPFTQDETEKMGLVFEHYAYAFSQQLDWKAKYYGYDQARESWERLQQNQEWPTPVKKWLPWVTDEAIADRIYK